jgi:C4-dicarboxylate-specific signal transduction histidine kinase
VPEIIYQWTLHQDVKIGKPALSLPRQPVQIEGDPLRIQQIMVNLLNNIVQSRHPDRLLAQTQGRQLTLRESSEQGTLFVLSLPTIV